MFAVNVWFSSPELPVGADKTGHKPIVLDLAFYHDCNILGCEIVHKEDDKAFHYQVLIDETPLDSWKSWTIDLDPYIEKALNHAWDSGPIDYAQDTLKLYQLDFVIELQNTEGAAMIDNFALTYEDVCDLNEDGQFNWKDIVFSIKPAKALVL